MSAHCVVYLYHSQEQDEETAMIAAARRGSIEVVKYLVENTTADVTVQNIVSLNYISFMDLIYLQVLEVLSKQTISDSMY